jgi:quercetin dioxygenase-like cupin family protein
MPVLDQQDAHVHAMHGTTFSSYVAPALGSQQICAWSIDVAVDSTGVAHRVSHEEVLLVTAGRLHVELDGVASTVDAGGVVFVPCGTDIRVGAGSEGATAWVTTSVGLTATTGDGTTIVPPWTQ